MIEKQPLLISDQTNQQAEIVDLGGRARELRRDSRALAVCGGIFLATGSFFIITGGVTEILPVLRNTSHDLVFDLIGGVSGLAGGSMMIHYGVKNFRTSVDYRMKAHQLEANVKSPTE